VRCTHACEPLPAAAEAGRGSPGTLAKFGSLSEPPCLSSVIACQASLFAAGRRMGFWHGASRGAMAGSGAVGARRNLGTRIGAWRAMQE
jgi:hypothetical protein